MCIEYIEYNDYRHDRTWLVYGPSRKRIEVPIPVSDAVVDHHRREISFRTQRSSRKRRKLDPDDKPAKGVPLPLAECSARYVRIMLMNVGCVVAVN